MEYQIKVRVDEEEHDWDDVRDIMADVELEQDGTFEVLNIEYVHKEGQ